MYLLKSLSIYGLAILSLFYMIVVPVQASESEFFDKFKLQAEQEDILSQYITGYHYSEGIGVRQDYKKAHYWLKKAADQDNVAAQFKLATMYSHGEGVRQNKSIAKEWFGKVCDNGDQGGCHMYKIMNEQGY